MQLQVETAIYKDGAIGNDINEAKQIATSYITDIGDNGISVHPVGNNNDRIQINSNGTEIYQGNESVAKYGTTARIGQENGSRFLINSDSLQAYAGTDTLPYFEVSSSGLSYGSYTAASTDYANNAAGNAETNAKEYAKAYTDSAIEEYNPDLTNYITKDSQVLKDLQSQIDGAIDTWYFEGNPTLNNEPAVNWGTEEQKAAHLRDLYFNTSNGHTFRWAFENNEYKWILIEDTDVTKALEDARHAQDTADGKRRIFVNQPTDAEAYDVGDLWVNATYGDTYDNEVLRCQTAKSKGEAFNINHWVKASKYTSDSELIRYKTEVSNTIDRVKGEINQNVSKLAVKVAGMYAISNTVSDIANKVATITPTLSNDEVWELTKGTTVTVKFTEANTTTSPTLNINNTGARSIRTYNGNPLSEEEYKWEAGSTFTFVYDETNWLMQDSTFAVQINNARTSITQTAESIESLASNNTTYIKPDGTQGTNEIKSAITQQAGQIALRVEKSGVIAAINASVETEEGGSELQIEADKVNIEGAAIFTSGRLSEENLEETMRRFVPTEPDTSGLATKDTAVIETQRIYYRSKINSKPSVPTLNSKKVWVTENGNVWNENNDTISTGWTTKITPIGNNGVNSQTSEKYLYLWTCIQWKTADNEVHCSEVLLDDSTTVIDGGTIVTGSITANQITTDNITSSNRNNYINLANGTFEYKDTNSWSTANSGIQWNGSNLNVKGAIYATSLTLGPDASITAGDVSGLSTVATTGSYNDLANTPDIPDMPDLTGYIYVDGRIGSKPAEGATGFIVETSGALKASNAVIYGSLYASKGYIGGWQIGTDGNKSLHNGTPDTIPVPGAGVIILSKGVRGPSTQTGVLPPNTDWTITAGENFGVTTDGTLYANGANIRGTITITDSDLSNVYTVDEINANVSAIRDDLYGVVTYEYISGDNTYVVYSENVSEVEGQEDIRYYYMSYTTEEEEEQTVTTEHKVYVDWNQLVLETAYDVIQEPTGNPQEKGWYELIGDNYILTEDTEVIGGKQYYEQLERPKGFIKGAIAERVNSLTTDTANLEEQYEILSNKEDLSLISKGYASISNDILTLFKQDNEGKIVSALELTSIGIDLKAEGALVATMRNDNGIGIMRATNMEQTYVKMIQTDGTELFQWIAQSNGHLSLKKM